MHAMVFTPTRLPGGLDVTWHSLLRQENMRITWVVADELLYERQHIYGRLMGESPDHIEEIVHFKLQRREGYRRNLAASYNVALNLARRKGVDLFVSLQDYITIPPDGIEKFALWSQENPRSLMTATCHISWHPLPEAVVDIHHPYSIFDGDFDQYPPPFPDELWWVDQRPYTGWTGSPIAFETNWAAFPRGIVESDVRFDETFDKGIAHENQDFAMQALDAGFALDYIPDNVAFGLPHKLYWADMHEAEVEWTKDNWDRYLDKWYRDVG